MPHVSAGAAGAPLSSGGSGSRWTCAGSRAAGAQQHHAQQCITSSAASTGMAAGASAAPAPHRPRSAASSASGPQRRRHSNVLASSSYYGGDDVPFLARSMLGGGGQSSYEGGSPSGDRGVTVDLSRITPARGRRVPGATPTVPRGPLGAGAAVSRAGSPTPRRAQGGRAAPRSTPRAAASPSSSRAVVAQVERDDGDERDERGRRAQPGGVAEEEGVGAAFRRLLGGSGGSSGGSGGGPPAAGGRPASPAPAAASPAASGAGSGGGGGALGALIGILARATSPKGTRDASPPPARAPTPQRPTAPERGREPTPRSPLPGRPGRASVRARRSPSPTPPPSQSLTLSLAPYQEEDQQQQQQQRQDGARRWARPGATPARTRSPVPRATPSGRALPSPVAARRAGGGGGATPPAAPLRAAPQQAPTTATVVQQAFTSQEDLLAEQQPAAQAEAPPRDASPPRAPSPPRRPGSTPLGALLRIMTSTEERAPIRPATPAREGATPRLKQLPSTEEVAPIAAAAAPPLRPRTAAASRGGEEGAGGGGSSGEEEEERRERASAGAGGGRAGDEEDEEAPERAVGWAAISSRQGVLGGEGERKPLGSSRSRRAAPVPSRRPADPEQQQDGILASLSRVLRRSGSGGGAGRAAPPPLARDVAAPGAAGRGGPAAAAAAALGAAFVGAAGARVEVEERRKPLREEVVGGEEQRDEEQDEDEVSAGAFAAAAGAAVEQQVRVEEEEARSSGDEREESPAGPGEEEEEKQEEELPRTAILREQRESEDEEEEAEEEDQPTKEQQREGSDDSEAEEQRRSAAVAATEQEQQQQRQRDEPPRREPLALLAPPAPAQEEAPPPSPQAPRATPAPAPAVAARGGTPVAVGREGSPLPLRVRRRRRLYRPDQLQPGEDLHVYDFPDGPRWSVVLRKPLAGGTLEIVRWEGRRMLRVWLPPGYDKASAQLAGGLPSVLLHDGQNVFGPEVDCDPPWVTWRAAETAAQLITSGRLPPFVLLAVDHPGLARAWEYTPYRPGTGPGGFRQDMEGCPGGGVWDYLELLVDEVLPWATDAYQLSQRPAERAMGGASFGGIATLCAAIKYPHVWGLSLVESPSLWLAEERLLDVDLAQHTGPWPLRVFVGMGGREFSGVRAPSAAEQFPFADDKVASYAPRLGHLLRDKGVEAVVVEVQPHTSHTNEAWAGRLPRALAHLGAGWWSRALASRQQHLYTTVPARLRPGCPAVLLVNRARSTALAGCQALRLHAGFNMNWEVPVPDTELAKAPWQLSEAHLGKEDVALLPPGGLSNDWWLCPIMVPDEAYEMHFALSGAPAEGASPPPGQGQDADGRVWDNNAGANFYLRVAPALPAPDFRASAQGPAAPQQADAAAPQAGEQQQQQHAPMVSLSVAKARQAMSQDPQPLAHRNSSKTFFTVPETLLAGAPAMVYFNKRRSWGFADQPNVKLHFGFNGWDDKLVEGGAARVDFKPTTLWRDESTDWWGACIEVPESALEMNFAFTNGGQVWDSNGGHNYQATVMPPGLPPGVTARPRRVESEQALPHGAGTMHILSLAKRDKGDPGYSKQGRWIDEKLVRVWTPPGWEPDKAPLGGWPVLYLSDGQNKFEDHLAHQGVAWRVGYQSSDLITHGELPPFLVVGIDNSGPMRSLNYLPYAPGTGAGGFRGDAERWPGGGVAAYMKRVTEEIMPLVQQRYGASDDPAKVAFGGGSFGGVCALYAALNFPHVFGNILAESPSLWIAEGRFLADMAAHKGALPERVFLACGTREYSATRDHRRDDVDQLLLHYCSEAARILDEKGCRPGQGRLRFHVEPEAGHHESFWRWRFSGAMRYLFAHLRDLTPPPPPARSET